MNPAPLIIIADNKSMGVGSRMPPLTARYIGFVNGDSEATALDSLPELFLPLTADGTVPGTFPIGVSPRDGTQLFDYHDDRAIDGDRQAP